MSFVRLLDMEMRKLKIVAFLDTGDLQMKGIAQKEIIEAIIHSPFFVVILSQEFIGKKIPNAELEAALEFDPSNKSTVSVFYNVTSKRYVQSPIERLMQLPKIERKGETEEQFAILVAKFVQGHIRQQLRQGYSFLMLRSYFVVVSFSIMNLDTLKVSNLGEFSERNWDEDVFQLLSELINELRQLTGTVPLTIVVEPACVFFVCPLCVPGGCMAAPGVRCALWLPTVVRFPRSLYHFLDAQNDQFLLSQSAQGASQKRSNLKVYI